MLYLHKLDNVTIKWFLSPLEVDSEAPPFQLVTRQKLSLFGCRHIVGTSVDTQLANVILSGLLTVHKDGQHETTLKVKPRYFDHPLVTGCIIGHKFCPSMLADGAWGILSLLALDSFFSSVIFNITIHNNVSSSASSCRTYLCRGEASKVVLLPYEPSNDGGGRAQLFSSGRGTEFSQQYIGADLHRQRVGHFCCLRPVEETSYKRDTSWEQ